MAYIPPAKRGTQSTSSAAPPSYGEPGRQYGRGNSYGDKSRYGTSSSYAYSSAPKRDTYAPPVSRSTRLERGERTLKAGDKTINLPESVIDEWEAFAYGNVTLRDTSASQLEQWRALIIDGEVTNLEDVFSIVNQLRPVDFIWAIRAILPDDDISIERMGLSRTTLLRKIGDAIRLNTSLAGEYYTPVSGGIYDNFSIWKDPALNYKGVYTGNVLDKNDIVAKTPGLSVITAVLQQAWLKGEEKSSNEEIPLSLIRWKDLVNYTNHVNYLAHVPDGSIRTSVVSSLLNPASPITVMRGNVPLQMKVPVTDRLTFIQYVLINAGANPRSWVGEPHSITNGDNYIKYDKGDYFDRLDMGRAKLVLVGEDEKSVTHIPDKLNASRLISKIPGTEKDAMCVFSALVEHFSLTTSVKKHEKIRIMSLGNLIDVKSVSLSSHYYTWPIMREIVYGGSLSYDFHSLHLAVPDSEMQYVAHRLSESLTPSAYAALSAFLTQSGARKSLLDEMKKHNGSIPRFLPTIYPPSITELLAHDKAVKKGEKSRIDAEESAEHKSRLGKAGYATKKEANEATERMMYGR
jgi:hypothetical protein